MGKELLQKSCCLWRVSAVAKPSVFTLYLPFNMVGLLSGFNSVLLLGGRSTEIGFIHWKNRSEKCQSTLCYWKIFLLQCDPSLSVKMIWKACEQCLGVCSASFSKNSFMLQLAKRHLEKLSVRAFWGQLLLHHRAEDACSSTRWHPGCMKYNIL